MNALYSRLLAQQVYTAFDAEREVMADGSRGPYRIGDRRIVAQSERIRVGERAVVRDADYRIDYRTAEVTFEQGVARGTILHAAYRYVPDLLKPVYRHRVPASADTVSYPGDESPGYASLNHPGDESPGYSPFTRPASRDSTDLTVGGSKTFSVGFGSDRDATLTQSLQLNLSGKLGGGVEVLGILSDRNLPIQPEGSTRTLSELDQVLLRIRSPSLSAGLGDMDVRLTETEFGRYERRIQGMTGEVTLPSGGVTVFGASARGAYFTRQIPAVEGDQGPYILSGSGERVQAGSERVFLDGERLVRGLSEDYVIDYDAGTIAFTPRRPITAESRIVVEAQGADGAFGRRIAGGRGQVALWDRRVSLGATMVRESDVRGHPTATPSLPATRPALAEASGGDSISASPTRHQVMGLDVAAEPLRGLSVNGEFAMSDLDRDPLSKGRLNRGGAFRTGLELRPVAIGLRGRRAGTFGLSVKARSVSGRFRPMGRTQGVEEYRRWGAASDPNGERSGEVEGVYRLTEATGVRLSYGRGRWGGDAGARRSLSLFSAQPGLPRATYDAEVVGQRSGTGPGGRLARHRAALEQTLYGLRPFFRFASERAEGSVARNLATGQAEYLGGQEGAVTAISASDWRYREFAGGLGSAQGVSRGVTWSSEWTHRRTARRDGGVWADSAAVLAQRLRLSVSRWRSLSLDGDYTHRSRQTYGASPVASSDHLAEGRLFYASRDGAVSQEMFYRLSSTRLEQRRRTFVEVGRGHGSYTWTDLNGDGRRDDDEYLPDPDGDYALYVERTGIGEPVRDATFSARLTVDLGRLRSVKREQPSPRFRPSSPGPFSRCAGEGEVFTTVPSWLEGKPSEARRGEGRDTRYETRDTVFSSTSSLAAIDPPDRSAPLVKQFLSALSFETSLDADRRVLRGEGVRGGEIGVTPWALGTFAAGAGVTSGRRSFQQDVYVFRYGRRLSVRARYRRDDSISREYTSGDLRGSLERSLRVRARIRSDLDVEVEAFDRDRRAEGPGPGYDLRSGEVQGRAHWRAGDLLAFLALSAGQDRDRLSARVARFFSTAPELVRSFRGTGRLRAAGEWTRTSAAGDLPLYLALTQGRRPGDTLRWEVGADVQVGRVVTASCTYTGRRLPGLPVIHLGQAEVQASF